MPHRLFKPHPKKRSKILQIKTLLVINILLLMVVGARVYSLYYKDFNILGFATNISVNELFNTTNSKRTENGLPALGYSQVLSNAAQKKAQDMFADDYWAHIAPDGKTPWDFIVGENYRYSYAGENLAKDFLKTDSVVNAWMNSPTHRENILNSNYTEVGFAVVNGVLQGKETTLVVQMFGNPYTPTASNVQDTSSQTSEVVNTNEEFIESPSLVLNRQTESTKVVEDAVQILPVATNYGDSEFINVNITYVKYFAYGLLVVLFISLIIDGFFAYRRGFVRVSGNTVSHLILFIASLLFVIYLNYPQVL